MVTEVTLTVVAAGDFTNCRSTGIFHSDKSTSQVYREWSQKGKTSIEMQMCGGKCITDVKGRRLECDVWLGSMKMKLLSLVTTKMLE